MKKTIPALCSLLLAATAAQAETYRDGVIYCKATVTESDGKAFLSVELPPTSGYVDYSGNPATVWNVGSVPAGGASDTFFSDAGPGAFQVKNNGNRAAFVYVQTGSPWDVFLDDSYPPVFLEESLRTIFGDTINEWMPQPADTYRDGLPYREGYRLAVSTDVTGKVPAWRPLNRMRCKPSGDSYANYAFREFQTGESLNDWSIDYPSCFQYLSYLAPGETQLFDLKFWAPSEYHDEIGFLVVLQASEFRLWPHDM